MSRPVFSEQWAPDPFSDLSDLSRHDDLPGGTVLAADGRAGGRPVDLLTQEVDRTRTRNRREARQHLEREVAARVARALAGEQAALTATLEGHQKALRRLGARVERLEKRRGGGFPWALLLLGGAAYGASVLYRRSPQLQEQVQGLLQRRPGPESAARPAQPPIVTEGVTVPDEGDRMVFRAGTSDVRRAGEPSRDPGAQDGGLNRP